MGLVWTPAAAGGPAALPGVEKKVEQVFNLFALEIPMERRRVVGFEVGVAWRRVVAAPCFTVFLMFSSRLTG